MYASSPLLEVAHQPFAFQALCSEVQEQPALHSRGLQVVDHLRHFSHRQLVKRFQFNDDATETNEVGTISDSEDLTFVGDFQFYFALIWNTLALEFKL